MILKPIKKEAWTFYAICKADKSCPLLDWLNSVPKTHKASKNRLLAIIRKSATDRQGPQLLPTDISHRVNDKYAIYEFIAGSLRLLWFYSKNEKKVIICSVGFMKKTRKTPTNYIDAAIRDKEAYSKAFNDKDIVIVEDEKT